MITDSYFEGGKLKELKLSSKGIEQVSPDDPIMVCCVKNDLERIKKVVEHHTKIGVKHMVFVDNESTDGTREWLQTQEVDLYGIDEPYHAGRAGAPDLQTVRPVHEADRQPGTGADGTGV